MLAQPVQNAASAASPGSPNSRLGKAEVWARVVAVILPSYIQDVMWSQNLDPS